MHLDNGASRRRIENARFRARRADHSTIFKCEQHELLHFFFMNLLMQRAPYAALLNFLFVT